MGTAIIFANISQFVFSPAVKHPKTSLKQRQRARSLSGKKSKAALLTEGHCVAALKGLLEAFVHKFVYVQHQGWVHGFAYTC